MGVSTDTPDKAAIEDFTVDPLGLGLEDLGAPKHIEAEIVRDANGEHTLTMDTSEGNRWSITVGFTVGRSLAPRLCYKNGERLRIERLPLWVGGVLDHLEEQLEEQR